MSKPVRDSSMQDQGWADLSSELTPAKSLARIDAATARAVTTVTVLGILLTGLGATAAGLPTASDLTNALAVATVAAAALAVASALTAQILTVTRGLNPNNLSEVKAWYQRQFDTRAYTTRAATVLLLVAALLAGATAIAGLVTTTASVPNVNVTQTVPSDGAGTGADGANTRQIMITVRAMFYHLVPGEVATVTIAVAGRILASAAATPASDGTADINLAIGSPIGGRPISLVTRAADQSCRATFILNQPVLLSCDILR
jgi:hypothetical protein